ncbi:MAG: glycoside hydrolase family 65 protein [Chthonomonadales bacterium]|nr:glycoside hydrolase family 65 protein [Chthonomonadales bacterium]
MSTDPWVLATTGTAGHTGGYLGNGFLGMRFGPSGTAESPDGRCPSGAPDRLSHALECYAAGLYVSEQLQATPNWARLHVATEDGPLLPGRAPVAAYRQELDLARCELRTSYRWPRGPLPFDVAVVARVHRDVPNLATIWLRVMPRADGLLRVEGPLEGAAEGCGDGGALECTSVREMDLAPGTPFRSIAVAQRIEVAGASLEQADAVAGSVALRVRAGRPVTVVKWVTVTLDRGAPSQAARRAWSRLRALRRSGLEARVAAHRAAWSRLWRSDVRIEGDPGAQHVVRAALFYLLCSVRQGAAWSLPPMGLSGLQWHGHVFWDADTWMLPPLAALHPELSLAITDYRFRTLPGARANARRSGHPGADYAWESAVTGRELAPPQFAAGRHVTADVGIAQWQQYLYSGDLSRLRDRGYPVLRATAEFWASRVARDAATGRYEVRRVGSPDESAGVVDNDTYTNAAVRGDLLCAARAARALGIRPPPSWERIAARIWLPYNARAGRFMSSGRGDPQRHRPKQAAAELLLFPLEIDAPWRVKAATLAFHGSRVSKFGPAMTASAYAVAAADLAAGARAAGRPAGEARAWRARALAYWRESYEPFVREPFLDFSEKRTMLNTTFLTGCAGVLSGVIHGFGGVRVDEQGLTARPVLPDGWTRLNITGLHGGGRAYTLDARRGMPVVLRRVGGPERHGGRGGSVSDGVD